MSAHRTALLSLLALLLSCAGAAVAAEPPPRPVLQKGDVARFIKTLPALRADLEALGVAIDAEGGNLTVPEATAASRKYLAILKKHGWDERFQAKSAVILAGYSAITHGEAMATVGPEVQKALAEIEANPGLPPEMKAQLKAQLLASQQAAAAGGQSLKTSVHEKDLALIRPRVDALTKAFQDER